MSENFKKFMFQAMRFGLVGVINTVITFVIYNLLSGLNEPLAWVIGYAVGIAFGLFAHARFSFGQKRRPDIMQTIRFIIINLISLGVSTLIISLMTKRFGINRFWSGIAGTAVSVVINFFGSRMFVFRTQSPNK